MHKPQKFRGGRRSKNCHIILTSGPSYHVNDKLERLKKGVRFLTTE
jgi:hypothetical protein